MKGILGRKIGMTQVYSEHGRVIPVSVIEIDPNIVTNVFTEEKDGYAALQLGAFDKKKSRHKKPELGHFKKSNTLPKRIVKEFRGMNGFDLGDTIDATIFNVGELVDVIGTSKGKGFAGAIKRHNQSIGPKSHGGGGGSQPQRQTGSLGDIAGNKVVKGMTMPGQMGNKQATVQNLEIIAIDKKMNAILVKGSIPGPKKSFVIVREAVKGLPTREAQVLVDFNETLVKNELLETAKKVGANVNTNMSIDEMETAISAAQEAKEAQAKADETKAEAAKLSEEKQTLKTQIENLNTEIDKAKSAGNEEQVAELTQKLNSVEGQIKSTEAKADEVKQEAKEAKQAAKEAEKASDKLQIEVEDLNAEEEGE